MRLTPSDNDDVNGPVTFAQILLTNKIMEQLIEELGDRLFSVRKLINATVKETPTTDKNYGVYAALLCILDQPIETNLWKMGEDEDE